MAFLVTTLGELGFPWVTYSFGTMDKRKARLWGMLIVLAHNFFACATVVHIIPVLEVRV